LAVGVCLDAFVVRLTLVPAVMAIVGSKLWYHAAWFEKYVPDPDIEGKKLEGLLVLPKAEEPALVGAAED
jgi:RND superfamily putative drug exporter